MKVILLNTYETGGAARACYRLFQGLTSATADVGMIVRGGAHSPGVISAGSSRGGFIRALVEGLPLHWYSNHQRHNFSSAWVPGSGVKETTRLSPDIVHLHWVVEGFVNIDSLRAISCPVVWTLHDSWSFTGGCHLPGECCRYMESCGRCPILGSKRENDWSRRIWQRKKASTKDLLLTIVSPSKWLADKARASSLFAHRRIEVIPNGIDTDVFCPGDRQSSRRLLSLPEDRQLLVFGANHALSDANKGFDLLRHALLCLDERQRQTTELVIFGERCARTLPDCGLPVTNFGTVTDDEQLVCLYRAADLFVAPSRQENLPNMVLEAMACGTPCVAFDVGGIPELIKHGITGYLARPYEVEDLAKGVGLLLANESSRLAMGAASRKWVEQHASIERVVERYQKLYQELTAADEHVD